MINVVHF